MTSKYKLIIKLVSAENGELERETCDFDDLDVALEALSAANDAACRVEHAHEDDLA